MTIAYHASHEQFLPSDLLKWARLAEASGFTAIHSSDHFHPWSVKQGQSGYSFSWIAAAMQATSVPFSMVCAPGQRYHPAIVAQAIATLSEMFPARYNIELGSGEAINEYITAEPWPDKQSRNARLLECVNIIRDLLAGKEVTFHGHVEVKEAKLYTRPVVKPLLFCAAISEETSGWAGSWADGLLTTGGEADAVTRKKHAFEKQGGKGKPLYVQQCFSYGESEAEAIEAACNQWKTNLLPADRLADLYRPEQFDEAASQVSWEDVKDQMMIITSIDDLGPVIERYRKTGVDRLILHNVNRNQEKFIRDFGEWQRTN